MDLSGDRRDLVLFLCIRTMPGFLDMSAEEKRAEFLSFAPLIYPLLDALPEGCTVADLEAIDFRRSAAITLVMRTKDILGESSLLGEQAIYDSITEDVLDRMVRIHRTMAEAVLTLLPDYELFSLYGRWPTLDLDEELRKLTEDRGGPTS